MRAFFDTNILVYAQEADRKGERARTLMAKGGVISVQVLNELANVLRKKHRCSWTEIEKVLGDVDDALDEAGTLERQGEGAAHQAATDEAELVEHGNAASQCTSTG